MKSVLFDEFWHPGNNYHKQGREHIFSPQNVSLHFVVPYSCPSISGDYWSAFCPYRLVYIFLSFVGMESYNMYSIFWSGFFHSA